MNLCSHFVLLATYNQWMNDKLFDAAGRLTAQELAADRGAFFGSILGTLNHLVVADTIWLRRFRAHSARYATLEPVADWPSPNALDQVMFPEFGALREHRARMDRVILRWVESLAEADMEHALEYRNTKGVLFRRPFSSLLLHLFNHQTHHRGQATTLLTQAGQDVGVTDLMTLVPNEAEA
ncbi:MAG: DinB family protein [Panacagrimonas sp.]